MGELTVVAEQQTISSLEISEMVGRQHSEVLKDLRRIGAQLAEGQIHLGDYFKESSYKDANNQTRSSYDLTKKGCELYATRMTGTKGTQFAVAYIERFNAMEQQLQVQQDPITLALEAALETRKQVQAVQTDVAYLKETMRIDGVEQFQLNDAGKKKVLDALGGKESAAYKTLSSKVFAELWRDFKKYFTIPRYSELPKVKFAEAMQFIGVWEPSAAAKMEVQKLNGQGQLVFSGDE